MAQKVAVQEVSMQGQEHEAKHGGQMLGPLLCWAVVFADIGTSVYYVPGILYGSVGNLAGFFVFLTLSVFVLLTLKYSEVTQRFPQGGGVVTVAAQAMNRWMGALGGMFILVDYFLTAAISCLSGILYFSVVVPALEPFALWLTIGILILLGILNWVGVSESAKVSLVGAVIAFVSDLAVLFTVFTHISFGEFVSLFPRMFEGRTLTPLSLLIGFAGSFLAFSGLESISQLSPVMKSPRKKVSGIALLMVVLTVGLTSPLLTMLSTLLLPNAAKDPVLSAQIVSLLGGKWGGVILETEVAISASALLVFASNTAIIGSYHVFMALSRMEFFPAFILQRNKLRGTPHYSIALATGIPILVLLLVAGNINILGDMYAFGLLGAFTLTCIGLDLVRHRERRAARVRASQSAGSGYAGSMGTGGKTLLDDPPEKLDLPGQTMIHTSEESEHTPYVSSKGHIWGTVEFYLGIVTTLLVALAWSTNLFAKPAATAFGGAVSGVGMLIAYLNYRHHRSQGRIPVGITHVEHHLPGSIMAVLTPDSEHNKAVIDAALRNPTKKPVVFLYLGRRPATVTTPGLFEFADPYLHDKQARNIFARVEHMAEKEKFPRRYVYRFEDPEAVRRVWRIVEPRDVMAAAEHVADLESINPDMVRYELTPDGKVVHLVKNW